jgi:hypothetical protein
MGDEGRLFRRTDGALYLYKAITIHDDDEALAFALPSQGTSSAIGEFNGLHPGRASFNESSIFVKRKSRKMNW